MPALQLTNLMMEKMFKIFCDIKFLYIFLLTNDLDKHSLEIIVHY